MYVGFVTGTAALPKIKTHVTGVIMHGQKPSSLLFTDFLDVPHAQPQPHLPRHQRIALGVRGARSPESFVATEQHIQTKQEQHRFSGPSNAGFAGCVYSCHCFVLASGTQHEDIDQLFSRIAQLLRKSIVKTVEALFDLLKRSFTKEKKPPRRTLRISGSGLQIWDQTWRASQKRAVSNCTKNQMATFTWNAKSRCQSPMLTCLLKMVCCSLTL